MPGASVSGENSIGGSGMNGANVSGKSSVDVSMKGARTIVITTGAKIGANVPADDRTKDI